MPDGCVQSEHNAVVFVEILAIQGAILWARIHLAEFIHVYSQFSIVKFDIKLREKKAQPLPVSGTHSQFVADVDKFACIERGGC